MRLIIIGNLEGHMTTASQIATQRGVKVISAKSIDEGLRQIRAGKGADLAFVDINLEIGRFIRQLESERIQLPVIACGLEDSGTDLAEDAILKGAREYLPLPPNPELIALVLESIGQEVNQIIHKDPATKSAVMIAEQIAPTEASVLITGESGVGKEVFARHIHLKSKRSHGPYVAINCAAIPSELLESELFGHEKGAFSGAIAQRIGKFEEANGGTLLLDEISEMDLKLQAKLLRVLQEREITRLGGNGNVAINVRIVATSNRALESFVSEGHFRQDLYYRLNVVRLSVPALRERAQDILLLADHFNQKYSQHYAKSTKAFAQDAKKGLNEYSWPGNIRELDNIIHRGVIMSQGNEITLQDLNIPLQIASELNGIKNDNLGVSLANMEKKHILDTYRHCFGNPSSTAAILGVTIEHLKNRLQEYGEAING